MMINGMVDNHLWAHVAGLSKQLPLSGIERIEVLYGPAGAVYGPNAFLGIINVITRDAANEADGYNSFTANVQAGSFDTRSIDWTGAARYGDWAYNVSAKYYRSDEAGLDDLAPWGFTSNELLANRDIWGPVIYDTTLGENCVQDGCPHQSHGLDYGSFSDRGTEYGVLADVSYKQFKLGWINWKISQGYGAYYPADRAQPGSLWHTSSEQYYLNHETSGNEDHKLKTRLSYRKSNYSGDWAEATPGSNALRGPDAQSWVSLSDWNSDSDSWLLKHDQEYRLNDQWQLTGGVKYERKTLTQAYDVCGYWAGSYCSTSTEATDGLGIALNTDDTINVQPKHLPEVPSDNQAKTTDKGAYLQGIWSLDNWRVNAGIRYDKNSIYGSSLNPRASVVHHLSEQSTIKLLYGTAFQEPAPVQLWGGWSGRAANPDLKPEKARNLELVWMYQQENWLHDVSLFSARYDNVIKEQAANAGSRKTFGLEYRGKFHFENTLFDAQDITGYLYYTYTKANSSVTYDHDISRWVGQGLASCQQTNNELQLGYDACQDFDIELGDIAPHKVNFGIDLPISNDWQVNLRGNWVASKNLYVHNPLRANNRKNGSYLVLDANINYQANPFTLSFKVRNLLDRDYYHSGVEGAASGDDFSQRSQGWHNSLIPQAGRQFMVSLGVEF